MTKETLFNIFEELEKQHVNLYHSVDQRTINKHVAKLALNINKLSEEKAIFEVSKIIAMFKDGHTMLNIPTTHTPLRFVKLKNKYYLINTTKENQHCLFEELVSINNQPISNIEKTISSILSYENTHRKDFMLQHALHQYNTLKVCGIVEDDVTYTFKNGTSITINANQIQNKYDFVNKNGIIQALYEVNIKEGVKYIRYSSCYESKVYPFIEFYRDINFLLDEDDEIILDLRGNSGGISNYFRPIVEIIKNKNIKGYCLIDNGVYSSGRFAVADLVKCGFTLVGTPTGANASSYGQLKRLNVDNYDLTVSSQHWDFYKVFNTKNEVVPNVLLENTIQDYKKGIDRPFEYCKQRILEKQSTLSK